MLQFILTVLIYFTFKKCFYWWLPLYTKGEAYFSPSIIFYSSSSNLFLLTIIVGFGLTIVGIKFTSWDDFHYSVRVIAITISGVLTWYLTTYDYNFFLNHWHVPERLFLLLSWFLVVIHPGFTSMLLTMVFIILSQFNVGPQYFEFYHFLPPVLLISSFLSYVILKEYVQVDSSVFVYGVIVLVGSFYFYQGLQKITHGSHPLEWVFSYKLHLELGFSWFTGWHWFLNRYWKELLYQTLKVLNRPLVIVVFLMEIGALFILTSYRISLAVVSFFIIFHTTVFFITGVFFWLWIIVDIGVIFLLLGLSEERKKNIFNFRLSVISYLFIILLLTFGIFNYKFAWWQTRYNYKLILTGVTPSKAKYELKKTIFSPYHIVLEFISNKQNYLIKEPVIPLSTFDFSTARIVNKNIKKNGANALLPLINEYGSLYRDEEDVERFKRFVQIYLKNYYNEYHGQRKFLNYLDTIQPPLFYKTNMVPTYKNLSEIDETIEKINIYLEEAIFVNGKNRKIKRTLQLTIPLRH